MILREFFSDKLKDSLVIITGRQEGDTRGVSSLFSVDMYVKDAIYCFGHCNVLSDNYGQYVRRRIVFNDPTWENKLFVSIEIPLDARRVE